MISIDRLAMMIAGKSGVSALNTLERFGFTVVESSEVITSHYRAATVSVDPDWQAVAVTIKSTLECSVRIGQRVEIPFK